VRVYLSNIIILVINIDLICVAKSAYHEYEGIGILGYEICKLRGQQLFIEGYAGERERERTTEVVEIKI